MSQKFFARIGFEGDSDQLIADVAQEFNLGVVQGSSVLAVGFEDCNIKVETDKGAFVIKAFATFRDVPQIKRYVNVMVKALEGGVNHPFLYKTRTDEYIYQHPKGVKLVVMDFIAGKTYFDSKTTPNDQEIGQIMTEAVKINALDLAPPKVFDEWSTQHIVAMYEKTKEFLGEEGRKLAQTAIERYSSIDFSKLSTCFVHGDLIATNVLKGEDGKIWVLDFAVSNLYPKIQEIAVVSTSLLTDLEAPTLLSERVNRAMNAYLDAGGTLTEYEQEVLFNFATGCAGQEFMGGHKLKYVDKDDSEESNYWIKLGRESLKELL